MNITREFKNGSITISNLKTEDGDYKCHFAFDITISSHAFSYTYHLRETVYFSLYDFIAKTQSKLQDECAMGNYLELTQDYFAITTDQDGIKTNVRLEFDMFEDQEKLNDLLLELKAYCEVLMENQ